jgi:ABC-type multidrug transport system fused ATPase/permease subunit
MIGQILPNNNESATEFFFPKILPSEHALSPCFRYVRISKLLWLFAMALFIRLIIRLFQLVFSVRTVFFSHNKSANSVFQLAYQHSQTGPILHREAKTD